MSEENRETMDPTELWKQWYETGSKMWSEMLQGGGESVADPYGLYGQWLEGMEELRSRISGGSVGESDERGYMDPQEMWRRWFDSTLESWQKSAKLGGEMAGMAPRWTEAMERAQRDMMNQESLPQDPVQFASQWYNAVSGPLSELVQDAVGRDEVLEPSSRLLQGYASLYKIFRQNSEEYLSSLRVPTRSDIARVAGLVVDVEEKVDGIEERLEESEDRQAELASAESVAGLEQRLEQRIDRVEGKLDRLISAVENGSSANGQTGSPDATDAARRKAEELNVDLSEIEGSGTEGRITVGDVRQKGES